MAGRLTLNRINTAIKDHGVELVKGNDYFYFAALNDHAPEIPSVYSIHLNCMLFEEWIEHVEDHL